MQTCGQSPTARSKGNDKRCCGVILGRQRHREQPCDPSIVRRALIQAVHDPGRVQDMQLPRGWFICAGKTR